MNTTSDKNELLNNLFKQLDKGSLSPSFRSDLMGRVFAEAAKKRKRAERLGLIAVCAASFVLVVLAVLGMLYTKIVFPSITMPDQPVTIFYLFIAALVALLFTSK